MSSGWTIALVGAALGVAGVGYALTGRPDLPAVPAPPLVVNPALTPEAEKASSRLLENHGDVRAWLTLSDALIRAGRTETAVAALETAIDQIPGDVNLWVQLGIALVAHAEGEVVPAARLAFDRASRIDPTHPAPTYYLGLAWLQAGEADRAIGVWAPLLAAAPADAEWAAILRQQLAMAQLMKRMQAGGMPPPLEGAPGP